MDELKQAGMMLAPVAMATIIAVVGARVADWMANRAKK